MKKKKSRYVSRFKLDDYNLGRWTPSMWETNSFKKALKHAEENRSDPDRQVWDYVNKRAL